MKSNRRRVLPGKGNISHEEAVKRAGEVYEMFRIQQDRDYISGFDRDMAKYLKGSVGEDE